MTATCPSTPSVRAEGSGYLDQKKNRMGKILLIAMMALSTLSPLNGVSAFTARVESIDGDMFQIADFSMDGRRTFSIDQAGGVGRIDWKEITSFEIKQVAANHWVVVQFTNGKKDTLRLRQHSFFRGKSEFGAVSVPFEKVRKVSLFPDAVDEKKKEDLPLKETVLPADSLPREFDRITLRNADVLVGDLVADSLTIRTVYGTVVFRKTDISRLSFGKTTKGQKDSERDVLFSKYGDKLSGTIPDSYLKIKLRTDAHVSISREQIQDIEFGVVPEIGGKVPQEPESPLNRGKPPDIRFPPKSN